MRSVMLYKDKAGNKLFRRTIKTRGAIQLTVKNRAGRLVNPSGTRRIIRKARIAGKLRF